ncbi:MAG: SapC family protein [Telluria sp.]
MNTVQLNNVDHKDLRVITQRAARYGDNVHCALTFPAEFRNIQAHYPIVFRKTADGAGFDALALLGFQEGENLFLNDASGWEAPYVPMTIERQPFFIGRNGEEMMVHVDMDSPRISRESGEAVFLPYGGNSDYLEKMNSTLLTIHQGLQGAVPFASTLVSLELLEPFVLDVELNDGSQNRLMGFYTINEDRLAALDGATLQDLSRRGYLQAIYMVLASLSHFRDLIDRKNRHHAIDL